MLITLLHAVAGGLLAVWAGLHAEWPAAAVAGSAVPAALLLAALGGWLAGRSLPTAPGRLRWDGQTWSLLAAEGVLPLQRVVVALDLGLWVLLRLHTADGRAAWRVTGAGPAVSAWHGLRVALAAHAGAAGLPDGGDRP